MAAEAGAGGGAGLWFEEEEEDDDDGEEGAFAAVVAAAAAEKGRKRLPTRGPLETRAQFTAFVEEGLASGLIDRYEAQAAKPFNTAWRHALGFAREERGALPGDAQEDAEEEERREAAEAAAATAAVAARRAAAQAAAKEAKGGGGGKKGEGKEGDENGGSSDEGEGQEKREPAFRQQFQLWMTGRRQVNRNTVRTYSRGIDRVRDHAYLYLSVCKQAHGPTHHTTTPPPCPHPPHQIVRNTMALLRAQHAPAPVPYPDTAEDVRALHIEEKAAFFTVAAGAQKGVRVAWKHFLDFLDLDAETYFPPPTDAPAPDLAAAMAAAPTAAPAMVPAHAPPAAVAAAPLALAAVEEEEEEGENGPSPSRQTLHHQGAAGGGLSDHIRDAFVVWLTEGRGFGRATAELTCQVVSGQIMAVMAGGSKDPARAAEDARPRFLKDLVRACLVVYWAGVGMNGMDGLTRFFDTPTTQEDVRAFVKERASAVPAFRRRGAGHGSDGWCVADSYIVLVLRLCTLSSRLVSRINRPNLVLPCQARVPRVRAGAAPVRAGAGRAGGGGGG